MSIFKACDIRGAYGTELTEAHAAALGWALAAYAQPPEVVVGGDGRLSTPALKGALVAALADAGVAVHDLGTVPTPAFYFARRELGIPAGVMVTASHNPAPDNGFKVTLSDRPLTEAELGEIASLMRTRPSAPSARRAPVTSTPIVDRYAAFARQAAGPGAEGGGLRVALDCANGMMGPVAPPVFRGLGWQVTAVCADVDGTFPCHPPNPAVAANLAALQAAVVESGAALGAAYDGDGDRVLLVDERGRIVDSDRAIVLMARQALEARPGGLVVYDQKCSDVVRDAVEAAGGRARLERSGYAFIKTALLQEDAVYAGEASGHHFFADIGGDDGLVASLRMAALVRAAGRPLSALVDQIPTYPNTPDIRLRVGPGEAQTILQALREGLAGRAQISELDGVRAQFADGWGLARPSVTEPVLTVRLEGRTPEALERVRREFLRAAPALEGRL